MNISDSERIAAVLESANYKDTLNIDNADLIVVTMCSVRQSAVNRVHGLVEKFHKLKNTNPKLQTVLTGCIIKKDKNSFTDKFNQVIDIREIKKLPKLLQKSSVLIRDDRHSLEPNTYLDITPKYSSKFSANVPIMTGCNNFCSYCVVPYAREREVSRPAKKIILEVKNLVKNGYKEIWLLGQNVNSYKDKPSSSKVKVDEETSFPKLLKMINDIKGDFWIRFTSSHPKDFNNEVIEALALGGKITPYLNLPIQSGDDKVIKLMNRHYTIKDYKNKIKKLRKKIPDISISTDIIVGFPGETKKQFNNTVKLFRDIKYDMAYINKYSPRAGTAASKLKDNVSWPEKKRREKVLTEVLKQTALTHNKKLIGKEVSVLIDSKRGENYFGKDKHYKTIKAKSDKDLLGKLVKVKITEVHPFVLEAVIARSSNDEAI
jgi:tRNA-2-methylthio-N6-dimethylallyladenosine synthase